MARSHIKAMVRQFSQNGLKLLLEDPRNVRDLLAIAGVEVLDLIDFDRVKLMPTTMVQRDYRHVEADVVLRAPLLQPGKRGSSRYVTIYILIEHQSEPDPVMIFRVLEYVVQIYKTQAREWDQKHRSFAGLRLQPVLPIVFYTGTRSWEGLGRMLDLVAMGEKFADVIPTLAPLFLNLSAVPANLLETGGGFFGWVLRLVQQRHTRPDDFQEILRRVVEHLETMPSVERLRWLKLLSYIHALVYHERMPAEHGGLQERIEASVRTDDHRKEISVMGRTIADALREEGRKEESLRSRQKILLDLLRQRYGDVPKETITVVKGTKSVEQLDSWLKRFATASSLRGVGIE